MHYYLETTMNFYNKFQFSSFNLSKCIRLWTPNTAVSSQAPSIRSVYSIKFLKNHKIMFRHMQGSIVQNNR